MIGGSAGVGAILGLVSNYISSKAQKEIDLKKQEGMNNAILAGKLQEYQTHFQVDKKGHAVHPPFYFPVLLITATYCVCVTICFLCGDIPVATQSFNGEPTTTSVLWGLIKRTDGDKTVYILTLAGLGTYFMSPLAFILTAVLAGIVPKRGV